MGEELQAQPRLATALTPAVGARRLPAIDLVRGLVMVIMALDHVRDYWHHDSLVARDPTSALGLDPIDPVNLDQTTGVLFLTRWITHFCVPTFVFLAGTGAFLHGVRCHSRAEQAWFLFSRGLWLIIVDLTLVRLGWAFNLDYRTTIDGETVWALGGGIIFVIGAAMVLLSPLVFLPASAVTIFGIAVIAFHNLLDGTSATALHMPQWLWGILHDPRGGEIFPGVTFTTGYGLLPCLGIMAAGYGFGAFYLLAPAERARQLLGLGLSVIALFVLLRLGNIYGDPVNKDPAAAGPWSVRAPWDFTIYSFLNCQKYPASLLYILMMLGPVITLLGVLEWVSSRQALAPSPQPLSPTGRGAFSATLSPEEGGAFSAPLSPGGRGVGVRGSRLNEPGPVTRFFVVFGRVPLFFYLLHVPLIHGLAVGLDYLRFGYSPLATDGCWSVAKSDPPAGYGVGLPMVYVVWILVVLLLYPLCRWFAEIKQRHKTAWLSYL